VAAQALLGIGLILLFDHNLKILLHINPELDCSSAAIKLATASLV
jgi:nanoRNase/pAp phosphatase (c-di-AMP/oligoRNAs hydrolase)